MKKSFYSLSGFGFVSIFIVGISALNSSADGECLDPRSPLRGSWSFSQVSEVTPAFGNLPDTAVGVIKVDNCGRFQGRATINIPCQNQDCFGFGPLVKNPVEVSLEEGQIITHTDGTATSRGTVFGTEFHRACVMMEKRGACFQEFHCVSSDPTPPNGVLLATFKRQLSGACQ